MNWIVLAIVMVIGSILIFVGGYMLGRKHAKNKLQTVGELIIYNFDDGIEPELYLELDVQPESFKTLPNVIFRTRNVKLGKPPRASQK